MVQGVRTRHLNAEAREFAPGSVHVGFVVDKVATGQVFLRVLRFSHVNIIPQWLSILMYHLEVKNRPVGGRSSET
jgi:hypothetical protein